MSNNLSILDGNIIVELLEQSGWVIEMDKQKIERIIRAAHPTKPKKHIRIRLFNSTSLSAEARFHDKNGEWQVKDIHTLSDIEHIMSKH